MGVFQGHQVLALVVDILWPLITVLSIKFLTRSHNRQSHKLVYWELPIIYIIILFLPNSVYAMLEMKHLLMIDSVADIPNIWSIAVFGGISLFGYLVTLYQNILIANFFTKTEAGHLKAFALLSIIGGFGGVAGLLNFNSYEGILTPQVLLLITNMIFHHPVLIVLGISVSGFIFLSTVLVYRFQKPSS